MKTHIAMFLAGLFIGSTMLALSADATKPSTIASYDGCSIDGEEGNPSGYQSQREFYKCRQGRISLDGTWTLKNQGAWQYREELGRLTGEPVFIGDWPLEMQRPSFQKWCATKYGWELCGWNEVKKVNHGKPPALKQ